MLAAGLLRTAVTGSGQADRQADPEAGAHVRSGLQLHSAAMAGHDAERGGEAATIDAAVGSDRVGKWASRLSIRAVGLRDRDCRVRPRPWHSCPMNLFRDADLDTRQALLDALRVAACLVEPRGDEYVVVAMNDLCRTYYGLDPQTRQVEISVESLGEASGIAPDLLEPIVRRMRGNYARCLAAGEPIYTENDAPRRDGSRKWSRNMIAPIPGHADIAGLLVSIVDITEVMEAQKQIEANLVRLVGQHVRVCRGCKRVLGRGGDWQRLEAYMAERSDLRFSHGICPACQSGLH